ncbi:MAG: cytochrome oxidase assembly protein [Sphingomonas bacterium]|jgi:cytochrome c oxidase assembly protein subunit 11|nr:cytochrome oxidase assembly protein [Sphingomonas bacterium]MDB5684393.1 cytochrome oxidase assembly protein [Sphingomonas bacterium]MDB5717632.1 cytochrome oxidase assembly protein [Sphingomonas bacterium]
MAIGALRTMQPNTRTGLLAGLLAVAMVCLGFASVPLYRMFCQVTGFAGTTQRADGATAPGAVVGKVISVRFDGNVSPKLHWQFGPEKATERTAIGARKLAFFTATNLTDKPITGTAAFNVTPEQAGKYFTKIQCFCFTEQTLEPHATARMPVTYYVDPKILEDPATRDISEITLSYTFFPVDSAGSGG